MPSELSVAEVQRVCGRVVVTEVGLACQIWIATEQERQRNGFLVHMLIEQFLIYTYIFCPYRGIVGGGARKCMVEGYGGHSVSVSYLLPC